MRGDALAGNFQLQFPPEPTRAVPTLPTVEYGHGGPGFSFAGECRRGTPVSTGAMTVVSMVTDKALEAR